MQTHHNLSDPVAGRTIGLFKTKRSRKIVILVFGWLTRKETSINSIKHNKRWSFSADLHQDIKTLILASLLLLLESKYKRKRQ